MSADEEVVQFMSNALQPEQEAMKDVDGTDVGDVMERLQQLLGRAVTAMLMQNVRDADVAARAAAGLYAATVKGNDDDEDLRPVQILANTIILYLPMIRALVYHGEARYNAALIEVQKAGSIATETLEVIAAYAKSPDAVTEFQQIYEAMLMILHMFLNAQNMMIQGEMAAFNGDLATYLQLLEKGARDLRRRVDALAPSNNELINSLVAMCGGIADRMYSRYENLRAQPVRRYLQPLGDKVFIVHGHDEAKWRDLRDLLEKRFRLDPIVLKEEPAAGATLIAKFEEYADESCYAFVLITPDDFIEKDGKKYFQARPNVLFELGWFCGHFGRDHVAIIKKADTALPSDLNGLVTIDFQEEIAEAVIAIEGELNRVGVVKQPKKRARKPKAAGAAAPLG